MLGLPRPHGAHFDTLTGAPMEKECGRATAPRLEIAPKQFSLQDRQGGRQAGREGSYPCESKPGQALLHIQGFQPVPHLPKHQPPLTDTTWTSDCPSSPHPVLPVLPAKGREPPRDQRHPCRSAETGFGLLAFRVALKSHTDAARYCVTGTAIGAPLVPAPLAG